MKRIFVLSLLVGLSFGASAMAGIDGGNGEVGFDFGVTRFDPGFFTQEAPRFALRGGYHLTRLFEIEAQAGESRHIDVNGVLRRPGRSHANTVLETFFVDGVFNHHSRSGNIVPYLLGGVGESHLDFPRPDASHSGFAYIVAAGSRFFFGERHAHAFRVEVSRIAAESFDTTTHHLSLMLGFTWRIGD